ncbi:MAG: 4Fe-4S binding domain/4Fe-4S dicluster domain-containing [Fusobacteria bacterium]|nr:MAG: 4Fe-4S binding domain/4Fe-4S dicluster domain-containing [Fusobacteriota bacterium]KAF0228704.1 MAG: 4Fe-4S binding domain/4Fe-4S dicluster [Fusobacteriota bacterium]
MKVRSMRTKIRKGLVYMALLIFPLTLNYFSPYLSVMAAMEGIIAGSILVFCLMFLSGMIFGRAWCAWICPIAGLSELTNSLNGKTVRSNRLSIIRYTIFLIWFSTIIIFLVLRGGILGIDPLFMSDNIISVDGPFKYITYYLVLAIFIIPNLIIGKRASCHSICWMSPFLEAGYLIGGLLRFRQLRIISDKDKCVKCQKCNVVCPMSINVMEELSDGVIGTKDCILCGECADSCPKDVLKYAIRK